MLCILHQMREALETKLGGLRRAFAEADSRCKLYMGENDRLQKELVTMREVLRMHLLYSFTGAKVQILTGCRRSL
jgi:hypothetical protein